MTLFIVVLISVSLYALYTILKHGSWLIKEQQHSIHMSEWFKPPIMIREQWRAVDYTSDLIAIDAQAFKSNMFYGYYDRMDPKEVIVRDQPELDYHIQRVATSLTKQMIRDGCIEIKSSEFHDMMPFKKLYQLRFKIYKPE